MSLNSEPILHARSRKVDPKILLGKIHRLEEQNIELASQALIDPLTGLYNRGVLDRRLDELGRSGTCRGVTILMLDVDDFKKYNEEQGHPRGDEVLKKLAKILLSIVEATDIVARYGGDEDTIIFPNIIEKEVVQKLVLRIHNTLEETLGQEGIHVSFGFATDTKNDPHNPQDYRSTLQRADDNLRKMKEHKNGQ